MEQNFDPSKSNITRQSHLGYPRLLSGDLNTRDFPDLHKKQKSLFPETVVDEPWTHADWVKRFQLKFPFYPFRTLCPRDVSMTSLKTNEFDTTSPMFPANTQINFVFQRRKKTNFLHYMLPLQLDPNLGTNKTNLSDDEYRALRTFTVPGATRADPVVTYNISRVDINVRDMYLQVSKQTIFGKIYLDICVLYLLQCIVV